MRASMTSINRVVRRCRALCCGKGSVRRYRYGCVLAGWHDHARYADDDSRTVRGWCGYDRRCKLVREGHGVGRSRQAFRMAARRRLALRAARHRAVPLCGCSRNRWHTGCAADADTVSACAADAMRWAAANRIVNGSHGRLNPQSATRAQAAAMLMRFCERWNNNTLHRACRRTLCAV